MLERCPHNSRVILTPPDPFCPHIHSWQWQRDANRSSSHIDAVPVDDADALRVGSSFAAQGCDLLVALVFAEVLALM
jgi:hypothetical protein